MANWSEMPKAPWTDDQVASLNAYQADARVHAYTHGDNKVLVATQAGWVVQEGGPVVQDWAHEFTLDWSWKEALSWLP